MKALLISLAVVLAAIPLSLDGIRAADVLWERKDWTSQSPFGEKRSSEHHYETASLGSSYVLGTICVQQERWRVESISTWFDDHNPINELQAKLGSLTQARLNVFPVRGHLPMREDPRNGRIVPVTAIRQDDGQILLNADNLEIQLSPGTYWIGLTPLLKDKQFFSLVTSKSRKTGAPIAVYSHGIGWRDE